MVDTSNNAPEQLTGALVPLGDRIRSLMQEKGLSQVALATKTGIDRADLNRLINGRRPPRSDEVRWIAEAFEITQIELAAGVELPERVTQVLNSIRDLETRVLGAEQRAERAEAERTRIEEASRVERERNLQLRLEMDRNFRTDQGRLRSLHQAELADVRSRYETRIAALVADYEAREVASYESMQAKEAETQSLRFTIAQREASLAAVLEQNADLRMRISNNAGAAGATALLGGLAGLMIGVGISSK